MANFAKIQELVAKNAETSVRLAREIWEYAELPFEEFKSAAALIEALKAEGFEIEEGIAGIPTAFTATFKNGTGKPVVGLLAEYDALWGLSQKAGCAVQEPVVAGGSGHGCGHNLLGAGCFSAAVALKDYFISENLDGTVIFFGCPAEEGAGSKQFIARAGYLDDVDFAYTWHPGTMNQVGSRSSVAIMGANFTFDGLASHAGGAPHLGRSALDAVELMNVGTNYLREHMIDEARVHYAYSDAGGTAPNVVQAHAVIKYEVRAPRVSQVQELFGRVVDIAKGAALMTGTKMNYEITMAFSDYVPSKTLAPLVEECMNEAGAPAWTEEDFRFAEEVLRTYNRASMTGIQEKLLEYMEEDEMREALKNPLHTKILKYDPRDNGYESGSTDVGDIGYATPTIMFNVATECLGNVGHSWQMTSFSGSDIGMKGMLKAAEIMALATVRTMEQPELIEKAKAELAKKNGGKYTCPLPEYVQPPIGKY